MSTKYRLFINGPYAGVYEEVVDVQEDWGLDPGDPDFDKDMQESVFDWVCNNVEWGSHPTEEDTD